MGVPFQRFSVRGVGAVAVQWLELRGMARCGARGAIRRRFGRRRGCGISVYNDDRGWLGRLFRRRVLSRAVSQLASSTWSRLAAESWEQMDDSPTHPPAFIVSSSLTPFSYLSFVVLPFQAAVTFTYFKQTEWDYVLAAAAILAQGPDPRTNLFFVDFSSS